MLVLSLGFVLTLVPAVEHLFYCFYLVETILNKIEACRFGNSGGNSSRWEVRKFSQNVFVLTLYCMVVTKGHTYLTNIQLLAFSCSFL